VPKPPGNSSVKSSVNRSRKRAKAAASAAGQDTYPLEATVERYFHLDYRQTTDGERMLRGAAADADLASAR
jgi:hypothetical protein